MSESKVAVITGAGSGIGRALAQLLAGRGFKLALNDWNAEALDATKKSVEVEVEAHAFDVSKRDAWAAFGETVLARFGRVDWVVNNAGVDLAESINDVSYEDFDWIMGINFWGVVHGTKTFLPTLLKQKSGAVVNVSSVMGLVGYQMHGTYCASKFAVRGFTESLRYELRGSGVLAACVHPGGIKTNIVRNSRFRADVGDINHDEAVSFFASIARTTPDEAARVIADGVEAGRSRILIGADAVAIDTAQRLMPVSYQGFFDTVGPKPKKVVTEQPAK
jgi:NADP-dependent 3-hydroxy acid dehydrogenase YdfG